MSRHFLHLVLVFLLPLVACSEATKGTGLISQKIGALARDPDIREVHLAKLTSFGWDRFYVIRSGASREEAVFVIHRSSAGAGADRISLELKR